MPPRPPVPLPTRRAPIQFPAELPISSRVTDIVAALERHQVVIVVGATGSGKTTQLPKVALKMGRGSEQLIGVTQPRRIAATSVATRVASELNCALGAEVGYQIRFEDRTSRDTWVKFMTDGILLAETQGDPLLRRYDTLIIDEAHERSLTIDFLLGWLKRILPERPDLKVIVSSATIASEHFSEFFGGAPVIQVEGRTFPVEVLYEPPTKDFDLPEAVAEAVENLTTLDPRGDILVFLPGEREIRESEQALLAKRLRHTVIQPLYSRLSHGEQRKIFENITGRRVILATNVAETSLTIPGIVYVVDTGVARLSRYDPRTGITRLQVEGISRASADQRKGRCGRVRDGICVRLYDEPNFAARPAFTDPEMKRTGLAGVILRMKSLHFGNVEDFPFLDPPNSRSIAEGYRVLQELGALNDERELTPLGEKLARFPVDPRIARMILAGAELQCLEEIIILAAALNIQDPRERPRGLEPKADLLHKRFRDESSDFTALLRLWAFCKEHEAKSLSQLRRACKDNFLSFLRVREWGEVHAQLKGTLRELDLPLGERPPNASRARRNEAQSPKDLTGALHQALLSGLLSRTGQWNPEHRVYFGARQTRFQLHPGSTLAKKPPAWVMAFELVETTQLFARTVAKVEPEWLALAGSHLLKRSYSEPHWSEKSARASVKEHATLFGLSVLRDKSVDYASIAPDRARSLFIEHALVRGEYRSSGAFQAKNQQLLEEVARLRDKARQSDMLADDELLYAFFDSRIPEFVVNGKLFESWRVDVEQTDPKLLFLALEDVLVSDRSLSPADYPDSIEVHGVKIATAYRFDPAAEDDGVTLNVPLALLPQLSEEHWTIPAWREKKITRLIQDLPRGLRRDLGAVPELASKVAQQVIAGKGNLLRELARALSAVSGIPIPEAAFCPETLPSYLRYNYRILGANGNVLAQSRDLELLLREHSPRAREAFKQSKTEGTWEQTGLRAWSFPDLPPYVTCRVQDTDLRCYPALIDRQDSVELKLFDTPATAAPEHYRGVRRLLMLGARTALASLLKQAMAPLKPQLSLPADRAEMEGFRDQLLLRVVEEAFRLSEGNELPRSSTAFAALVAGGTPRLVPCYEALLKALKATAVELDKTLRALATAAKQPSGTAAIQDIQNHLQYLLPSDLLLHEGTTRLEQFPRYLRAGQARLARALTDPRKDALKAAPFTPIWLDFLAKSAAARDPALARELRWALEELRVSIFAPELKPVQPLAIAAAALRVKELG